MNVAQFKQTNNKVRKKFAGPVTWNSMGNREKQVSSTRFVYILNFQLNVKGKNIAILSLITNLSQPIQPYEKNHIKRFEFYSLPNLNFLKMS